MLQSLPLQLREITSEHCGSRLAVAENFASNAEPGPLFASSPTTLIGQRAIPLQTTPIEFGSVGAIGLPRWITAPSMFMASNKACQSAPSTLWLEQISRSGSEANPGFRSWRMADSAPWTLLRTEAFGQSPESS